MDAAYDWNFLSAGGSSVFLAAVLSAFWLRVSPRGFAAEFCRTLFGNPLGPGDDRLHVGLGLHHEIQRRRRDARPGLCTNRLVLSVFAPLLGWLGVVVTGSDTSSNAMFGSLQRVTAQRLGLNPVLIVASNSTGGVMGKMIAAQSIVVAAAATNQKGGEGRILRFVLFHSIVLAALIGLLTLLQAYVFPGMVPTAACAALRRRRRPLAPSSRPASNGMNSVLPGPLAGRRSAL